MLWTAYVSPELTPVVDAANTLGYATDGHNVETVIAGGRGLMEGRRVLTIDEDALDARVRPIAPRLTSGPACARAPAGR